MAQAPLAGKADDGDMFFIACAAATVGRLPNEATDAPVPTTAAPCVCERADGSLRAYAAGCPTSCTPWRGAGANLFDAFWCTSSGAHAHCSFDDSLSALQTATTAGLRYARFFASDWKGNRAWWYNHEEQYWDEMDKLFAAIDASGMSVIPSLGTDGWDLVANAVTPGLNETANDYVRSASSVGRALCKHIRRSVREPLVHPPVGAWQRAQPSSESPPAVVRRRAVLQHGRDGHVHEGDGHGYSRR